MKTAKNTIFAMAVALAMIGIPQTSYAKKNQAETDVKVEKTSNVKKSKKGNFARGAKLWANRCTSCHNVRAPKDLTDSEWKATMMHMRIRAGLSGQDTRDILVFLQKSN